MGNRPSWRMRKNMPFGPKNLKPIPLPSLQGIVPVGGFPGYFISPEGKLFCIREVNQHQDQDGYARLKMSSNGKSSHAAIHILMAKHFLPPPSPGEFVVRHLDDDPTNNSLDNLAWGTVQDNANDRVRNGGQVRGELVSTAILTEAQVISIRREYEEGTARRVLRKKYRVKKSTLEAVLSRRNWKHV